MKKNENFTALARKNLEIRYYLYVFLGLLVIFDIISTYLSLSVGNVETNTIPKWLGFWSWVVVYLFVIGGIIFVFEKITNWLSRSGIPGSRITSEILPFIVFTGPIILLYEICLDNLLLFLNN